MWVCPPLRLEWITERGDTTEIAGRIADLRDDGRRAVRDGQSSDPFSGEPRPVLRAKGAAGDPDGLRPPGRGHPGNGVHRHP